MEGLPKFVCAETEREREYTTVSSAGGGARDVVVGVRTLCCGFCSTVTVSDAETVAVNGGRIGAQHCLKGRFASGHLKDPAREGIQSPRATAHRCA